MFALVDCNSFYASCEAVFQPRLWGRPLVVLSNNDGCVIARSPEAKAAGVPMGAPAFQWRDEFKRRNIEVFSSNYELYGDMSARVMETLRRHAPAVEIYSIDEAFVGLDGLGQNPAALAAFAAELRAIVLRWTGIPVGVGVARTKTLAKLANRQAKKTGGTFVLDHESQVGRDLLEDWPCVEIWGVAARLGKRLAHLGIISAGQLARAKRSMLRQRFGVVVERTALELGGTSCLELEEVQASRKNLCCSRSFGQPCPPCGETLPPSIQYLSAKVPLQNILGWSVAHFRRGQRTTSRRGCERSFARGREHSVPGVLCERISNPRCGIPRRHNPRTFPLGLPTPAQAVSPLRFTHPLHSEIGYELRRVAVGSGPPFGCVGRLLPRLSGSVENTKQRSGQQSQQVSARQGFVRAAVELLADLATVLAAGSVLRPRGNGRPSNELLSVYESRVLFCDAGRNRTLGYCVEREPHVGGGRYDVFLESVGADKRTVM